MTAMLHEKEKNPLIMIVEDIPKNMEIVCNILRREKYRLAVAGNGKQAVDMVREVMPDLILLDVMMPGMDGFQVCEILKENPLTCEIPIIFLTAKADSEDVVAGFELGAVDYITKPFKKSELLSRVRTHLELKFSRDQLQQLNHTKDKFFSIIAHDLKDPLQYLLLSADTLYHNYEAYSEEKKKDYVRRFYNNSQQLSALLENLLQWSRSQKGLILVKPVRFDIAALAAETISLLAENAEKKQITLTSSVKPGSFVQADRNMIQTVIRNLVSNALKFTLPQGNVIINARPLNSISGSSMEISVMDTGIGMSDETVAGLFSIDKVKSTPGTAKEKGTGLGLIICKDFVEKNGGTIKVTSEPGKGSKFRIVIPGLSS